MFLPKSARDLAQRRRFRTPTTSLPRDARPAQRTVLFMKPSAAACDATLHRVQDEAAPHRGAHLPLPPGNDVEVGTPIPS